MCSIVLDLIVDGKGELKAGDELTTSKKPNPSLKLTRLSPQLYRGGWGESEEGQREVSGKPVAFLSPTR